MLKGKTVILGVTGGIAAYKMPNVARMLKKVHCNVHVIMTENACNFITPTTFETLTGNKCLIDTFDRNFEFSVEHVALAKQADLVLIAPATANIIGKIAHGIGDDMLTTTLLACPCKCLISPAMNHNMYLNKIVQHNIEKLKDFGYEIIEPEEGMLANGDMGYGRMPKEELLVNYMIKELAFTKDLAGMKLLVTAGPTREPIDPVRFITNHSSGKMGYAIAKMAAGRGASVRLISGPVSIPAPAFVDLVRVTTAAEMYNAVMEYAPDQDIIIKAAAVADYQSGKVSGEKIKKNGQNLTLELSQTKDILKSLGDKKQKGGLSAFICGFAMETSNLVENAKHKLMKKNVDMIVANNLKDAGAGFLSDTNILTIITDQHTVALPLMSKEEAANQILNHIIEIISQKS